MGKSFGYDAKVDADADAERRGDFGGLARAVAEAATEAAGELSESQTFEVTRIYINVDPNPGPTAYKVVIKPVG